MRRVWVVEMQKAGSSWFPIGTYLSWGEADKAMDKYGANTAIQLQTTAYTPTEVSE